MCVDVVWMCVGCVCEYCVFVMWCVVCVCWLLCVCVWCFLRLMSCEWLMKYVLCVEKKYFYF